MEDITKIISLVHHVLAIIASSIAIYLFWTKKKVISSVFKALMNFAVQLTFSELKLKLDHLNDLHVDNDVQSEQIINIFHEIVGQMRGNKLLSSRCSDILKRVSAIADNPSRLTEAKKRSLVHELREILKFVHVENMDELIGDKHE